MKWNGSKLNLPNHMQEIKFKGKFPFECNGFFEKTESGHIFFHKNREKKKIYQIYGVTHWMPLAIPTNTI